MTSMLAAQPPNRQKAECQKQHRETSSIICQTKLG